MINKFLHNISCDADIILYISYKIKIVSYASSFCSLSVSAFLHFLPHNKFLYCSSNILLLNFLFVHVCILSIMSRWHL